MIKRLFLIIGTLTMLTACGGPPDVEDRIPDGGVEAEYTGIISILPVDLYNHGTHVLDTGEDEVLLRSKTINLSNYLDEGTTVSGLLESVGIEEKEQILTVYRVGAEEESFDGETEEYENKTLGYRFRYPTTWNLNEGGNTVYFTNANEQELLYVRRFSSSKEVDEFVKEHEKTEGTPVTVAAQKALRYIEDTETRLYLANPSKQSNYRITFKKDIARSDDEAGYFNVLETMELIFTRKRSGPKCGGEEAIQCDEGLICEFESNEENAEGVCISLDDTSSLDCPFIPVPTSCKDYRVSSFNKEGCPVSYKCTGVSDEEFEDNISDVFSTLEKYQDKILAVPNATIIKRELLPGEDIIVVTYVDDEKEYETAYSFTPSANEFNYIELFHEEKEIDEDELEAIKENLEKVEIEEEKEVDLTGFNIYENPHKDFSVAYDKNWYFQSFGSEDGSIWSVGFASDEMDDLSDAEITVEILEGKGEGATQETGGLYFVQVDRDSDSHFLVKGPIDLKETLDIMAASIKQN